MCPSLLAFDLSFYSIFQSPLLLVLVNFHVRCGWFPLEDPSRGLADLTNEFVEGIYS